MAKTYIKYTCKHCLKDFEREVKNTYGGPVSFCSKTCAHNSQIKKVQKKCAECNKDIFVRNRDSIESKSGNNFCNRSCSASYNNKNKTHGTRRSKLEKFIEDNLIKTYPNLEIHFNRKDAINSELDIYMPSLSLAVELNGIFHYEPIYGKEKLESIQNNDNRKFQACLEKQIELCIIDTSSFGYFKEDKAMKYVKIITDIIDSKLRK